MSRVPVGLKIVQTITGFYSEAVFKLVAQRNFNRNGVHIALGFFFSRFCTTPGVILLGECNTVSHYLAQAPAPRSIVQSFARNRNIW